MYRPNQDSGDSFDLGTPQIGCQTCAGTAETSAAMAFPISSVLAFPPMSGVRGSRPASTLKMARSEEHTSELQSHLNLVCRLLLEKKKKNNKAGGKQQDNKSWHHPVN